MIDIRLINADALVPDADYDDGEYWAYSLTQVKNAQTINPVRKGHKINQHSYPAKWLCSECGAKHFDFSDKFCSECGVNVEEGE